MLLLALLSCLPAVSRADVRLPDGQYFEQVEDLRVKVIGGHVSVSRTWMGNQWFFNPAWAPLLLRYGPLGEVSAIERAGWRYERRGTGVWVFDNKNSITAIADGYRWQDRRGNWVEYSAPGRMRAYGDRNDVKVSFAYDVSGRLTGVFDHFDRPVLWVEYELATSAAASPGLDLEVYARPAAFRDSSGRRVQYDYARATLIATVTDVLGHPWQYTYDGAGRLISRTDPENHSRAVSYAPNGRVSAFTEPDGAHTAYGYDYDSAKREVYVKIIHPGGRTEEQWYDLTGVLRRHEIAGQQRSSAVSDGRTLTRTEASGAQTKEEFDEWDNLVKRTYADGGVEILEREPRFSQLARHVDENGNETRYEYDARGNLIRRIDAVGKPETRTTEYATDAYGNRTSAKRPGDAASIEASFAYAYDNAGNLIEVIDPEGNIERYSYDIQGNVLTFSDALDGAWSSAYDMAGRLTGETDPLGQIARYAYDKVGNLIAYTDRRGQVWRYEYDARDRHIASIDPLGHRARTEVDPEGYPVRELDEESRERRVAYDPLKRLQAMRDGKGNVVTLHYPEQSGERTSSFAPNRIVYPTFEQEMGYDARNRLTALSEILGQEVRLTRYEYDKAGNRVATINAEDKTTRYDYDALNRLIKLTDTLGHVTELNYDNRDNLLAVKDANGHLWAFEYDRKNRRLKQVKPRGETTVYRYDAADQLVDRTDAKGQHLVYDYDASGRLTRERHYATDPSGSPPVKQIVYAYDAEANVTGWDDGEASATQVYDALSRLETETVRYGAFSLTYRYAYYANGLKKSLTYPDGTTYTYTYDAHNELAGIEIPGEGSISVNDFRWTAPTQVTLPGGTVQRHEFDGLLRPTGQEVTSPAAADLLTITNRYGSLRQLRQRTIDGVSTDYSYDSEMRLIDALSSDGRREAYTLDAVANRISDGNRPGPWEYDHSNRLLSTGDTTYSYDANGNLTRRSQGTVVINFLYDIRDRLVRVEDGNGNVVARYGYDPIGRRLRKHTPNGATYFLYAGEGLIGEYNGLGQETAAHGWRPGGIWGTDPLFYRTGGRYFYAHTDHLGTPLVLTDKPGNVVWAAAYTAFGQASVSSASTVGYNLRLPGQYFDAETGLHQNWLRYYDPGTGRYTRYDPLGIAGSVDGFAYANANPVTFTDPRGDIAPVIVGIGYAAVEAYLWGYARCLASCGLQSAAIGLLVDGCISPDILGDCAKDCAMPWNWFKAKPPRAVKRIVEESKKRKEIIIDASKSPDSAKHLEDFGVTDKPLPVNRAEVAKRRRDAVKNLESKPGFDRDEAPPAVLRRNDDPVSVRHVPASDNRSAGAQIGNQIGDADEVVIRVTNSSNQ